VNIENKELNEINHNLKELLRIKTCEHLSEENKSANFYPYDSDGNGLWRCNCCGATILNDVTRVLSLPQDEDEK
jgi:hypothetical protein